MGTKTIGFTFFRTFHLDFFNVDVAYKPGDNKAQTEKALNVAMQIVLEENQKIMEVGDTLMKYYTKNIGYSSNLGQAGNHTGALSVFWM